MQESGHRGGLRAERSLRDETDEGQARERISRSGFVYTAGAVTALLTATGLAATLGSSTSTMAAMVKRATRAGRGVLLGRVRHLPRNHALAYTDPHSGDPALLIRLRSGVLVSYDAVCTHAGCTVTYDTRRQLIVCPCHASVFDPMHGGKVLSGPAPSPLPRLPISVDKAGNVYALDAKPGHAGASARLHQPPPPARGDDGGGGGGGSDDGRRTRAHHRLHGDDGGGNG